MKYIDIKRYKFSTILKNINFKRYNFLKIYKYIDLKRLNFKSCFINISPISKINLIQSICIYLLIYIDSINI